MAIFVNTLETQNSFASGAIIDSLSTRSHHLGICGNAKQFCAGCNNRMHLYRKSLIQCEPADFKLALDFKGGSQTWLNLYAKKSQRKCDIYVNAGLRWNILGVPTILGGPLTICQ